MKKKCAYSSINLGGVVLFIQLTLFRLLSNTKRVGLRSGANYSIVGARARSFGTNTMVRHHSSRSSGTITERSYNGAREQHERVAASIPRMYRAAYSNKKNRFVAGLVQAVAVTRDLSTRRPAKLFITKCKCW